MQSTSLAALTTTSAFPNVSCWSSQALAAASPAASGIGISSYVDDFCTTKTGLSVLPGLPLARNWTVEDHTIEVVAEVDTSQSKCRQASFTINETDLLCYTYLNKIADICDFENTNDNHHGSTVVNGCAVWSLASYINPPEKKITPRAMSVANWDKFYNKGKAHMQALDTRLEDSNAQDRDPISKSSMNEKLDVTWNKVPSTDITLRNGVEESDHFYDVTARYKELKSLYYHNFFSPRPGVIVAASNVGYDDETGKKMPWKWSTLVGSLWIQACAKDKLDASGLKWVLRDTITNTDTKNVLQEAFNRAKVNMKTLDTIEKTFTRKDEAFYAILGTPNGNGIPWILKEWADHLGKKTITSITVIAGMDDPKDPLWDLKFAIGDSSEQDISMDRTPQQTGADANPPEVDPQNVFDDEDYECGCMGLSCLLL